MSERVQLNFIGWVQLDRQNIACCSLHHMDTGSMIAGACAHASHADVLMDRPCMQALKEMYLPESGKWIADYPHVNRSAFLDISLSVEQERQSQRQQFEYSN